MPYAIDIDCFKRRLAGLKALFGSRFHTHCERDKVDGLRGDFMRILFVGRHQREFP